MKTVLFFLLTLPLMALPEDLEENVAYVEEFAPKGIKLKVAKLKQVHTRQLLVRELIAKKEVAIGMTPEEVSLIHRKPTKTKILRNAKGQTQVWEFSDYEKINHYTTVRDPYTGAIYRRLSHTTTEETSKTVVEFENDFVSAIEISENNGPGSAKIVTAPIIFTW